MARIPFVVIGGFLGAGKTTLLNRWLQEADGQRLAVLVNDFGELNVDAALVARRTGSETLALSNGCVCCSSGGDLSQALIRVLAMTPPFDAIVVEASGVADPWRVAQYALADPELALAAVVVLVDASAIAAQAADPLLADSLTRPLAHADLVLLNKTDLCRSGELAAAEAWVASHAPGAPVLPTVRAELPWSAVAVADVHVARGGLPRGALTPAVRHGDRFEAWSAAPDGRFDEARLRDWLRDLPPGVLRLKGLLPVAGERWVELQFAGRHATVRRVADAPPAAPAIVAIGLRGALPASALGEGLQACLQHNSEIQTGSLT